jgi:hypothetical protein
MFSSKLIANKKRFFKEALFSLQPNGFAYEFDDI